MTSSIAQPYKAAYGLIKAPYIMGYSIYVAGTIQVRNVAGDAAGNSDHKQLLVSTIDYLDDMCNANEGVKRLLIIIRQRMKANKIDPGYAPAVETFDLEMIFNMFPLDRKSGVNDMNNMANIDYCLDPLFGLMNYPCEDFPSPKLLMDDSMI
ncbi:hypothetical protein MW887_011453 [Aspergillus wentii]|nr:hypothetical protein MW887_011453 [Aspergillus wentii]